MTEDDEIRQAQKTLNQVLGTVNEILRYQHQRDENENHRYLGLREDLRLLRKETHDEGLQTRQEIEALRRVQEADGRVAEEGLAKAESNAQAFSLMENPSKRVRLAILLSLIAGVFGFLGVVVQTFAPDLLIEVLHRSSVMQSSP